MRIGLDARLAGAGLGVSRLIRELAVGLPAHGVELVWLGSPDMAPTEVTEAVQPPGPGFAGLDSPRGRRFARELRIDLIHFAANSGWWTVGSMPYVMTVHDVIWARPAWHERNPRQMLGHTYLRLVVPRALRGAAAVACPSATAADELLARYRTRAEVISNGVSAPWWDAAAVASSRGTYVVAFAGRDSRKATDVVLQTCRRLPAGDIRVVLLAGAGVPRELQGEVARLEQAGRLEVLPYLDEVELANTVAGAVALLYPSRDEGFGLPVAEAMATGVPVITGLAPVTLEIGGEAVIALDPNDPVGSAVNAVRRLLQQPDLRASLGERGRDRARAFSWQHAVAAYQKMYERQLEVAPRVS